MARPELVERLTADRIPKIEEEFRRVFPQASARSYIDPEGRGIIKILQDGYVVGMEFVETDDSWSSRKRMWEYYVALVNKCRLVLYVPKEHAIRARMRMLEFNHHWLNYYIVYSYDDDMHLEKIGRIKVLPGTPLRNPPEPLGGYW